MAGMRHKFIQSGFTLLELVVVVLVIAVIAGVTITAFNSGYVDDQELTATNYEMTQVRDAILSFMQDNPTHDLTDTTRCTSADASFLLDDAYDTDCDATADGTIASWNVDYRLGWRGPYISQSGTATAIADSEIEVDSDIGFDGDDSSPGTLGTSQSGVPVILDAYNNPYYFFDLDDTDAARIVSSGPDGIYDSYNNAVVLGSECDAENDDIVMCLR